MSIARNIQLLLEKVAIFAAHAGRQAEDIFLVAVSKGHSVDEIQEAYWAGIRDFAENRVQEALEKKEKLPSDIRWHFIGKLQKNKVNKVIGQFVLIHSVDSFELAQKISLASVREGIQTAILLEANTSSEPSKSGLSAKQWEEVFPKIIELNGLQVHGLMTMAPLTEDESIIRHCFSETRMLKQRLEQIAPQELDLSTLSMGMTNDYPIAIQEGATLLRIGAAIFHETF